MGRNTASGDPTRIGKKRNRTHSQTFDLYEGDAKLLEFCQEFIGCSKAEVMRTGLRSLAASLEKISKR